MCILTCGFAGGNDNIAQVVDNTFTPMPVDWARATDYLEKLQYFLTITDVSENVFSTLATVDSEIYRETVNYKPNKNH